MKSFRSFILGLVAAVAVGFAGLAAAQYIGYNPSTGITGFPGTPVAYGTLPVLDATSSCGTLATVVASEVGGAGAFQITANATSCTVKVNFPSAAPNGYFCVAADETTPADSMKQSAHSTTSCTVTGTVVSGDKILIDVQGF